MNDESLPARQVHLDFHTSPLIPEVGARFDPERFAQQLVDAEVQSVTLFARCHHGHLYYDSKLNPERIHPHLCRQDLLRDQIEACHARGIRTPVYTTVQWDHYSAKKHRDWLLMDERGCAYGTAPLEPGFYRFLDVFHTGYRDFLRQHVKELMDLLPLDGLFFDIVQPRPSLAPHWLVAMTEHDLDPEDPAERLGFARQVVDDWKQEMTQWIQAQPSYDRQDFSIFYNAGHIGPADREAAPAYTHFELESLASGGWGYLHFPMTARYARTLGKPCLGMTGKFHGSWGEFHGYKNQAAQEFECFHMLALGCGCSIGDQLHPSGELDPVTYRLIGNVYERAKACEPWCRNAEPVADIGLLTTEPRKNIDADALETGGHRPPATLGALRMLQELHQQFDILDQSSDLSQYRLLILPDNLEVTDELSDKIQNFLSGGGSLLASGSSGLGDSDPAFAAEVLGLKDRGLSCFGTDFLRPGPMMLECLEDTAYVMYKRAREIEVLAGTERLAEIEHPYFDRTWEHFCSHLHAPSLGATASAGITQRGSCIYFAHPVFTEYHASAPLWCKQLVRSALRRLIGPGSVSTSGPSTLLAMLNHQPSRSRYVLHLLHYIPERRGATFDTIEDIIPLHDLEFELRLEPAVKAVRRVPEDEEIAPESVESGVARFRLPKLHGQQMLEIAY